MDLDASSSFVTITDHNWEIRSDTNDLICLSGERRRKSTKHICRFSSNDWDIPQAKPWSFITALTKGCADSTRVQNASMCDKVPKSPGKTQFDSIFTSISGLITLISCPFLV